MRNLLKMAAAAAVMFAGLQTGAHAQDLEKVDVAIGQGGKWDASLPAMGVKKGIFEKHGLELNFVYTQGGGETQQIIISGSADIGFSVGTQGTLGAYAKGAPIRVLGSVANGDDAFYFVRADSPIQSMDDLKGGTLAFSRNGSSTHSFALGFVNLLGVDAVPTATGGPPSTITSVMSGQVDVGWSAPPFGLDLLQEGKIRQIASSRDLPNVKDHTVRLIITNVQSVEERPEMIKSFMDAYRETIEWAYSTDEALEMYAEMQNISVDIARMVREEFDTREYINPDVLLGIDDLMKEAVEFKYIDAPLTDEQLNELVLIEGWER